MNKKQLYKARQQIYDAIKKLRLGETVEIDGRKVIPFTNGNGYCMEVLCKLRNRITFATICWKDAGPNPRLYNSRYFLNRKHIYGVVE